MTTDYQEEPPQVEEPQRKRPKTAWVVGAAALLAGGAIGFGVGHVTADDGDLAPVAPAAKTVSADGTLALVTTSLGSSADGCYGTGGYSDIHRGTQVVISDASGKTVALGALSGGGRGGATRCEFSFHVDGIPKGEAFYKVEVSHRGGIQYTESQLASLALTLGS